MLVAFVLVAFGCASEQHSRRDRDSRWKLPVINALDVNRDGVIDSAEIANAPAALLTLDGNKDGKLSYDEVHWTNRAEQSGEPEPVIQVLDADHNDVIDAGEIAGSPAALSTLP